MFGKLNRKMLAKYKPYSADASTWATAASLGRFYYWDPEDKKEYLIVLNPKEKASGKNISYSEFPHKASLDRFLKDTFGYDHNQLVDRFQGANGRQPAFFQTTGGNAELKKRTTVRFL